MSQSFQKITNKIQGWNNAQRRVRQWQEAGNNVVFTNGCFDLLHYGHIKYLAEAADLGDKLVVALNAPSSIQRLKGAHRPIKDRESRLHLMASLAYVDLVVEFEQDTPLELIKILLPDILVKGGDWTIEQIIGSDEVIANGGIAQSLSFVEGYSTTAIETKIRTSGLDL